MNYEFPPIGGGSGTGSRYLARELVMLGHEVEVVTSWFRGLPKDYRQRSLRIRRLRTIRKMAGQCRPFEMISYVVVAFFYLLLRRGPKPDVIVSFHSIPSGMPALPLSILWRVPHIVLFRGGDVPGFLPQDLAKMHARTLWLNRAIVNQAKVAAANSAGLRRMASQAFPSKEIGVLANGVDSRVFTPPEDRKGRDCLTFIFAGRMTNQKGLNVLVRAVKAATEKRPGLKWRAVLIGEGPVREEIEALVSECGLTGKFEFPGWVERRRMAAHYQNADILVFPSRYEGMPNVVLEAMSAGLPVVGTHVAGTEELVKEELNGFLVEKDDIDALADRIGRLIDDEDLRLRMGAASRDQIEQFWSWTQRAEQLAEMGEVALEELCVPPS
ncbi:glycosyltransferase family 4 protein [bacterium]|nr:glycosyltransferase family 4 protein [bacterium]